MVGEGEWEREEGSDSTQIVVFDVHTLYVRFPDRHSKVEDGES